MKLRILIFVTRMNVGGVTSLILEQISKSSNPDLEYFLVYGSTESNEIEDSRLREIGRAHV